MQSNFRRDAFERFRVAHIRAQYFIIGWIWFTCLILGAVRWLLGTESPSLLSREALGLVVATIGASLYLPRFSYRLTRHMLESEYWPDQFGRSYSEYEAVRKKYEIEAAL
jgi:hypothetical protein